MANTRSRARRSVTTTIENGEGSPNNWALDSISLAHKRQEHFYSTWIFLLSKIIQFMFEILWNNTLEVAFD
jgi:hypothetical protein